MQPISYPAQPIATQHQITLHNETIQYTARVGFMPIRHATSGVTEGHLFYVYYSKNGVTDKSKRPVWFLFNGGPGAATIWLHMGAFGPKMVKMKPNGMATPPPYTYVDNPNCLLDTGDLVFIDAMGTGFSRPDRPGLRPEFRRRGKRPGRLRRVHPQLPEPVQPLGLAALCRRRKLRHHARRGTGRLSHRSRHSHQRRDAALGSDRFQRRRGRAAPTEHAAHRNHDRALSQEAAARSSKAHGGADRQTGARIRLGRISGIPVRRRARHAGPARQGADRHGAVHRAVEELHRRRWTCGFRWDRSARNCCATST